jgi:hypothetical protein
VIKEGIKVHLGCLPGSPAARPECQYWRTSCALLCTTAGGERKGAGKG